MEETTSDESPFDLQEERGYDNINDDISEDLITLHEDILEENEEGVKEILGDFATEGLNVYALVNKEINLGPNDPDFDMTAVHRAAAVGSTSVFR